MLSYMAIMDFDQLVSSVKCENARRKTRDIEIPVPEGPTSSARYVDSFK